MTLSSYSNKYARYQRRWIAGLKLWLNGPPDADLHNRKQFNFLLSYFLYLGTECRTIPRMFGAQRRFDAILEWHRRNLSGLASTELEDLIADIREKCFRRPNGDLIDPHAAQRQLSDEAFTRIRSAFFELLTSTGRIPSKRAVRRTAKAHPDTIRKHWAALSAQIDQMKNSNYLDGGQ